MTKSIFVPFVLYSGTSKETSRSLYNFFLRHLEIWKSEVDKIYIIDSGDFLESNDPKITIIKKTWKSHWENLNEALANIVEDSFLIMDSDTVIYRPGVITSIFHQLESNDIVSILDNSGGEEIEKDFPFLQPNSNRSTRRRFAPYLFACKTDLWKKLGHFDFTPTMSPNWTDSMGEITRKLLALSPKIEELPDDRTTIFYNEGNIQTSQWLDGGEYAWSQKINPDYGYYHLRNMGGALQAFEGWKAKNDFWTHVQNTIPTNELYRLLTWVSLITHTNIPEIPQEYKALYGQVYPWIKELQ